MVLKCQVALLMFWGGCQSTTGAFLHDVRRQYLETLPSLILITEKLPQQNYRKSWTLCSTVMLLTFYHVSCSTSTGGLSPCLLFPPPLTAQIITTISRVLEKPNMDVVTSSNRTSEFQPKSRLWLSTHCQPKSEQGRYNSRASPLRF